MEKENRQFKMISLFSGSGGFEFTASLCGIEPVAASEVEPYPIKVTRARFPHMKHLGDISEIHCAELEPVDFVTGGSPCQSLSQAGNRDGMSKKCLQCGHLVLATEESDVCPECGGVMAYTRSGLFMEQIRVIKEMREADYERQLRMRGTVEYIRPRFMLWENVTGAFSSNKGEDFRAVLEETARICDKTATIPRPPKGKWHNAGLIVGDGYSIAWRVLDAQFWGVPQRRRRIALVADFGGQCAGDILFKRDGLQRNFTESRHSWQNLTRGFTESIGEAGECVLNQEPVTMQVRCGDENGGGKGALLQVNLSATLDTRNMQTLFQPKKVYGITSYQSNSMKSNNPNSGIYEADTSRTIDINGGNPNCNQGGMIVCEPVMPIPIQDQAISNGKGNGLGIGEADDPMYSLMAETIHGVCVIEGNGARPSHLGNGYKESDIMYTLNATEQHAVAYGIDRAAYNNGKNSVYTPCIEEEKMPTLVAKGCNAVATYQQVTGPLMANSHPGSYTGQDAYNDMFVANEYIARRLMPIECSRLQGMPDWWCDGTEISDPTEEDLVFWREVFETHRKVVTGAEKPKTDKQIIKWLKEPGNDGAKYKLWGNGIAIPCFLYVMEGIKEVLERTSENITSE